MQILKMETKELRIFRDGRKHQSKKINVLRGLQGNLAALNEAREIVRFDSLQTDLKRFAFRTLLKIQGLSLTQQIETAFLFCRDQIIYEQEQDKKETVSDLWSTLYSFNDHHASGDCLGKSIALATFFRFLGLKPFFVVLGQIKNVDYYNHVYVGILDGNGKQIAFDPTPKQFRIGDEAKGYRKLIYPIF